MVKILTHIITAFLLLITTTGFAVSSHYCRGELKDVSINDVTKSCCATNNNNCCRNEVKVFKVSSDFSSVEIPMEFNSLAAVLVNLFIDITPQIKKPDTFYFINSIPPPTVGKLLSIIQSYIL